jgi:WD40 repeat protein
MVRGTEAGCVQGQYMATGGTDGTVKVWDLRSYKELHAYRLHKPVSGDGCGTRPRL